MPSLSITPLSIPDVTLIKTPRFHDERGYFVELVKLDVLAADPQLSLLQNKTFPQSNESSSHAGVVRGLHAQSQPPLDKLVRVPKGRIIDIAVDIRPNSATFGQAVAYELAYKPEADFEELLLVPFGFAHGFIALEECRVQYFQTGIWNKDSETCIRFTAPDINWSGCETSLQTIIGKAIKYGSVSDKDAAGLTIAEWATNPLAQDYQ
jgi:dTDP-4-dehydrorhamnose 3,5-epimerase